MPFVNHPSGAKELDEIIKTKGKVVIYLSAPW
jgi:hypothetical protein